MYKVLVNLGYNFFAQTNRCRKHTGAYRGLKVAPVYLARVGLDSTRKKHIYQIDHILQDLKPNMNHN